MSKPHDRAEFLIRFACGVIFFGLVLALLGLQLVTTPGLPAVTAWVLLTLSLGFLVALRGDPAWRTLASFFRWW
jgi:hypothetical protein